MKYKIHLFVVLFFSILSICSQTELERETIRKEYDLTKLNALSHTFRIENKESKAKALSLGFPEFYTLKDGRIAQLQKLDRFGKPVYYTTNNTGSALTSRVNRINSTGSAGLDLNGQNMIVGIWDGDAVRPRHDLLIGRVEQRDGINFSTHNVLTAHATHVSGTMMGSNSADPNAQGMAYEANLWAHDWWDDDAEMALAASQGLLLSNHSYGISIFDATGSLQVDLFWFGKYEGGGQNWDKIMFNAPYYLAVDAAGNDRTSANLVTNKGGYDMLVGSSTNKNGICVAGVTQVSNYTGPASVIDYWESNWGGTDDGRVKPDISAKAVNVYSSTTESDATYSSYNGTSMAAPGITGALTLLQQHHNELYGSFMRSATVKGLALHTADEAGPNPGPDFMFGWGLMNAEAAANALSKRGIESYISEEDLSNGSSISFTVEADPSKTLMASICWTDPAGEVFTSTNDAEMLDNPIPALVNDLDIRIEQNSTTYMPWKLQPPTTQAAAQAAATTGDNLVDNIEKIEVENPTGSYIVTISHKGVLKNGHQNFSLIITGIKSEFTVNSTNGDFKAACAPNDAVYELNFQTGFTYSGTTNLTVTDVPTGAIATLSQSTIDANGDFNLTMSDLANVTPGQYTININAVNSGTTFTKSITLWVLHNSFGTLNLTSPSNNSLGIVRPVSLTWVNDPNAQQYTIEIATDNSFTTMVGTTTVNTNSFTLDDLTGIEDDTKYFWRVKPLNDCTEGNFSSTFNFTTQSFTCNSYNNSTVVTILETPSEDPYLSNQVLSGGASIDRLKVHLDITHTWVGDLTIKIISPQGTEVVLHESGMCSGEEYENFDVTYDSVASELMCSETPPAVAGTVRPLEDLGVFNGEVVDGTWTLSILDPHNQDGGSLNSWDLIICEANTVGIEEFSFANFNIWPNPTNDVVTISLEADNSNDFEIKLFDMLGRSVKTINYPYSQSLEEQISVDKLSRGIYLLKVSQGSKHQTQKLIIE